MPIHCASPPGVRPGDTVTVGGTNLNVAAISRQAGSACSCVSDAQAEALGAPAQHELQQNIKKD